MLIYPLKMFGVFQMLAIEETSFPSILSCLFIKVRLMFPNLKADLQNNSTYLTVCSGAARSTGTVSPRTEPVLAEWLWLISLAKQLFVHLVDFRTRTKNNQWQDKDLGFQESRWDLLPEEGLQRTDMNSFLLLLFYRGGVFTPGAAFSRTKLIDRLNQRGVEFSIISSSEV